MSRTVFVVNCGSSSVKHSLIALDDGSVLASGTAESVTDREGRQAALHAALAELDKRGVIAVAHRVVHGGDLYDAPVVIDAEILRTIRDLSALAPLHNPANAEGIEIAQQAFPDVPHVAVFDTAFHQTLPPRAYTYAVPATWQRDHGVRRYGFHGTSYAYVAKAAADFLGRPLAELNLIVLHLGNGASAAAIEGGRSVETSMGLTPLEGLVMGTRSGDLDPAVPFHLARVAGMSYAEVDDELSKHSGMLGLAGSSDMRDVEARVAAGDAKAQLALEIYGHRLRKYVGAYYAVLGRVDAIVFTAGVGENQASVRAASLAGLERLGIAVSPNRNVGPSRKPRVISPDGAEVSVLVIPTQEELEMARQTAELLAL